MDQDPPCPLLTYLELTNSGGRILRGGKEGKHWGALGEVDVVLVLLSALGDVYCYYCYYYISGSHGNK